MLAAEYLAYDREVIVFTYDPKKDGEIEEYLHTVLGKTSAPTSTAILNDKLWEQAKATAPANWVLEVANLNMKMWGADYIVADKNIPINLIIVVANDDFEPF